jgi:hypothetical protein
MTKNTNAHSVLQSTTFQLIKKKLGKHEGETQYYYLQITDFRLSWWLAVDVKSVLQFLRCVAVDNGADISELHAVSFFRVEVYESLYTYITFCCFEKEQCKRGWTRHQ